MDETLRELADDAGIEYSGQLPTEKGDDIPPPEITQNDAGDWLYVWRDATTGELIGMKVSALVMQTRELSGFLTVIYRRTLDAKPVTLLSHKEWKLRSTSHTNAHVTSLNRRMNRNWDARLTQAATHIEANFHFGDEGVWLDEVTDPGPLLYLIDKVVEQGQHTVIAAEGGSLKSMLASAFAISLAEGLTALPGLKVARKVKTLYIDYETDKGIHKRRYDQLLRGIEHGPIAQMVMYKRLFAPLVHASDEIHQLIRKHKFEFVVIDSASRAVGGETVSEGDVIPFFNAVSSWGITALTIAHKSKMGTQGPSGNAQWRNQARSYWEVEKDQVEGDNVVRIALKHDKGNNNQLWRPIGFRVEFANDAIRFFKADAAESAVIAEKLPLVEQINNYLLLNANSTAREIAEALDKGQNRILNLLSDQEGKLFRGSEEKRNRRWSVLVNPVNNPVNKGGYISNDIYIPPVNKAVNSEAVNSEDQPFWAKD